MIANLAGINALLHAGHTNDIWIPLYINTTAGDFQEKRTDIALAVLAGERDDIVQSWRNAIKKKDAAEFVKVFDIKIDNLALAQKWKTMAEDEVKGLRDDHGRLPSESVSLRVPIFYNLLYDGWDMLNHVTTLETER
jgi:hypothetical protein